MFIWGIKIVLILLLPLQGSVALVFVSDYGKKTLTVLLQIEKNSFLSIWDNLWQDLYLLSIIIHFLCLMLGFFTNHCANSYFQQKDLNKNCKIDSVPTEKKVLVSPEITLPLVQLNYNCHFFSVSTWGSGVDIILDCVGGSYWEKNLNCLSTDGRWIIYGLLSGGDVNGDLLARLLSKRGAIHTSLLRSRDKEASSNYQQCI